MAAEQVGSKAARRSRPHPLPRPTAAGRCASRHLVSSSGSARPDGSTPGERDP